MSLDFQAALDALRSGEEAVRRATVDQLGRSGLREAIGPLLMAVGDDSWPVRQAATAIGGSASSTVRFSASRMRWATTRTPARPRSGFMAAMTANSSPPRRATKSLSRTDEVRRSATVTAGSCRSR